MDWTALPEAPAMRRRIRQLLEARNLTAQALADRLEAAGEGLHFTSLYRYLAGGDMAYGRVALVYNALLQAHVARPDQEVRKIMMQWRNVQRLTERSKWEEVAQARDDDIDYMPFLEGRRATDLFNVRRAVEIGPAALARPGPAWRGSPPAHVAAYARIEDVARLIDSGERFLVIGPKSRPQGIVVPFSLLGVQSESAL